MIEHKSDAMKRTGMGQVGHIHFVGIGGTGMGGIAEVLHNLGYQVSGSDHLSNEMTKHLTAVGIEVKLEHHPQHVLSSDVVVFSSAIPSDNSELLAAYKNGIPVIPRAVMLAELMRFHHGIAVAGTHGKTTTTSLIASILTAGDLDPTYVVGGLLNSSNSHARLGTGQYLIAEADESDASFLHLQPMLAVLTNIDSDHLESYGGDPEILKKHFIEFLHLLPFYGLAIICLDDPGISKIIKNIARPFKTYGFNPNADYFAHDIQHKKQISQFKISRRDCAGSLNVELNLPGDHNILNALAAIAVSYEIGVTDTAITTALSEFQGIARRFEILGELNIAGRKILAIDDYAHHPHELEAILTTVRQGWADKRVIIIFQPHRYTRTISLFEDFCRVLSTADKLLLLNVYSAGEQPIVGADSRTLCRAIRQRGRIEPIFVEHHEQVLPILEDIIEENDILLILGAGNISAVSSSLVQHYG